MEVIGSASAIVGLVEFSGSILCLGYSYIAKVVRAPKEVRALLSEIASLDLIFDKLREAANEPSSEQTLLDSLSQLGTLEACKTLLEEAERSIRTCEQKHVGSHSAKDFGRRLLWPFRDKETQDMMQRLKDLRSALTDALNVDTAAALRRLEASQGQMKSEITLILNSVAADQKSRKTLGLLKWLCPEDSKPNESLHAALQSRQSNTCEWFFRSDVFRSWTQTDYALLWIYGIPGCGKTVLSSTAIEYLKSNSKSNLSLSGGDAVVFFYCDHRDVRKQTAHHLLMNIAAQLFRLSTNCIDDVSSIFESKKDDSEDTLREDDYHTLIQSMFAHFNSIFIIIDALDESMAADAMIRSLQKLVSPRTRKHQIRVLITSRYSLAMEHLIGPSATAKLALHDHTRDDILTYVTDEVQQRLSTRPPRIRDLGPSVVVEIVTRARGLFLQTKLQIDYVCALKTPGEIKAALVDLPSGLEPIYDRMLEQIVSRYSQSLSLVRRVLNWVLGSRKPLALDSLAHAVAMRLDDDGIDDDNIADADELVEMCGSFVNVEETPTGGRVARVAHFSVLEYFRSDCLAESQLSFFHMQSLETHLELALICLKYLSLEELAENLPQSSMKSDELYSFYERYPLYHYAANHWMTHLRRSRISQEDFSVCMPYMEWFLQPKESYDHYCLWQQSIASEVVYAPGDTVTSLSSNTGWHPPISYAIAFGLEHVFDSLFSQGAEVGIILPNGHTLLTWAVKNDQIRMVTKLLDALADPNQPADLYRGKAMTPLHLAAEVGSYEMTVFLLEHGAIPDTPSRSGATPFYRAVRSRSLPIMKKLKEAGVNINVQTWDSWTPVYEAVRSRNMDALTLLLEWGARADVPIHSGRTPLSLAEEKGYTEIRDVLNRHIKLASRAQHGEPPILQQDGPVARLSIRNGGADATTSSSVILDSAAAETGAIKSDNNSQNTN